MYWVFDCTRLPSCECASLLASPTIWSWCRSIAAPVVWDGFKKHKFAWSHFKNALKQTTPPHSTGHVHAASLAQPPTCWFFGTPCPPPTPELVATALFFICQDSTMRYNTHVFQQHFKKLSPGFAMHLVHVTWIRFHHLLTRFSPCFFKFLPVKNRHHPKFNPVSSVFIRFSAGFSPSFEVWYMFSDFTKFSAGFLQIISNTSRETYKKR